MVALKVTPEVRNMAGVVVPDRQKPGEKSFLGCGITQRAQACPPLIRYEGNLRVNWIGELW